MSDWLQILFFASLGGALGILGLKILNGIIEWARVSIVEFYWGIRASMNRIPIEEFWSYFAKINKLTVTVAKNEYKAIKCVCGDTTCKGWSVIKNPDFQGEAQL